MSFDKETLKNVQEENIKSPIRTWVFSLSVHESEKNSLVEENQKKWIDLIQKNINSITNPSKPLDPKEEEAKQKELEKKRREEEKLRRISNFASK